MVVLWPEWNEWKIGTCVLVDGVKKGGHRINSSDLTLTPPLMPTPTPPPIRQFANCPKYQRIKANSPAISHRQFGYEF